MTHASTPQSKTSNIVQPPGTSNPWPIAQLMQHNPRLLARFVFFRQQLKRLAKGKRRWLVRRAAVTLTGAALLLALSGRPAHANAIVVADGVVEAAVDGQCSLVEAIENANSTVPGGRPHVDCLGGSPGAPDTIYLGGGFFELNQAYGTLSGATGLPIITSEMTIEGEGATITRNPGADPFRIMAVSGGKFTLNDTTVSGGKSNGGGGGIYAFNSSVIINRTVVSGNTSVVDESSPPGARYSGMGGGIVSYLADITITDSTIETNTASTGGGGIFGYNSEVSILDSVVTKNTSSTNGGGIGLGLNRGDFGALHIVRSSVEANAADQEGGGIWSYYLDTSILDSTIAGNSAGIEGGGVFTYRTNGTFLGSTISGNSAGHDGGGVWSYGGEVEIENSTLSGNSSGASGGGLSTGRQRLHVRNSTFVGNSANVSGGGILVRVAHLTVNNSEIAGNSAARDGGGLWSSHSEVSVSASSITGNSAKRDGGASWSYSSNTSIIGSTITENSAERDGGGAWWYYSDGYLLESTISGNIARSGGGGIHFYGIVGSAKNDLAIVRSTVSQNTAIGEDNGETREEAGGGLSTAYARLMLENSTISGNHSGTNGGGVSSLGGVWEVHNTTFVGNSAATMGGGIYVNGANSTISDSFVQASIISGNTAPVGREMFIGGNYWGLGLQSYYFNVIGHSSDAGLVNYGAPFVNYYDLVPAESLEDIVAPKLADNGGPTLTHALPAGSPAIDLVDDGCYEWLGGVDQRGQPRNIEGNGIPSGRECDAGAFEFIPPADDGDGVDDAIEDGAPNNGDGNYDGVPDSEQPNVTSLPNAANGDYVTIEAPEGTVLQEVTSLGDVSPGNAPPNVLFPLGYLSFQLSNLDPGQTVSINLYLENPETINSYFKYGPTVNTPVDHWYSFAFNGETGVEVIAPDRLTLHFVDGKRGDSDLAANGTIVDPGGPALVNNPPIVNAGTGYDGEEGAAISLDGASAIDAEGDTLTYKWSIDSSLCSFSDDSLLNPEITCGDNGSFTATLTASDGVNDPVSSAAAINVINVAPTISALSGPTTPIDIENQTFSVSVAFGDPGSADTHAVTWEWGDGTSNRVANAISPATLGHVYGSPGVYTVTVTVTDHDGGFDSQAFEYIVVFDTDGGFVTGGGWIISPASAYVAGPSLTGKATFGFVSKYKKGANVPTGNTQFSFKAGDLNFHSSEYEWLVVNQNGTNAQYKGSGTVNGEGNYKFMLWASDGEADTFRIKIWYEDGGEVIVYDNGFDQTIGGGNIVVHTGKK